MPPRPKRRNNYHRNAVTVNRKTTSKDEMVPLELKHRRKCMFCGHKDIDETLYGPMYKLNDVVIHYFCILLSSLAVQHGADEEGIWGFLLDDIKKELKRGSTINCFYCKQTGATISCCNRACRKVFHLPCGLKNGSMHQFFQTFKSFCQQHRITQTVDLSVLSGKSPTQCAICKEDIVPAPLQDNLWAPCCKRNSWFHRRCVQDMALSAGYFFKCPLCNNVEIFKFRMLTHGIYIPSRDASWETVPDAFAELLDRPSSCTATTCLCTLPEGRDTKEDVGDWNIVLCSTCGSCGIHMLCGSVKCDDQWNCESCVSILAERSNAKKRKIDCLNDEEPVASTSGLVNGEPVPSTSRMMSGEPVPSTSGMMNGEPVPSTSGMMNGEPVPSTSGMMNGEPVASTSGSVHRPFRVFYSGVTNLSLNGLTNGHAVASTSRLSNGHAEVSTSGLSNGHTEASTSSRLSNVHSKASTRGLSNGHAEASTSSRLSNGYAVASTSRFSSNDVEAITTKLKNRRATSSFSRIQYKQPNESARESTNSSSKTLNLTSTPTGYNLRRSSRKLATEEPSNMKISIRIGGDGIRPAQSSSSNNQNVIESIVISDSSSDSDDSDVQIITFLDSHIDDYRPAVLPVVQHCRTVPPDLSKVRIDSLGRFVVESIDLTLEED